MSREIEHFIESRLPSDLVERLSQLVKNPEDLRNVLLWQEDAAHRLGHILDTRFIFRTLAEESGISASEIDLGDRASKNHDIGKKLESQGVITREEHHYASAWLTSFFDPEERVLQAIIHHVDDVLPANTPLWIRLVRDADRISSLGHTAANRMAIAYFGFRDRKLEKLGVEEAVNTRIFCDLRFPNTYHPKRQYNMDYENNAGVYFVDKVVPYLFKNGKLDQFEWFMLQFHHRVYGIPIKQNDAIIERSKGLAKPVENIEPVCELALKYYHWKIGTLFNHLGTGNIMESQVQRGSKPSKTMFRKWYGHHIDFANKPKT